MNLQTQFQLLVAIVHKGEPPILFCMITCLKCWHLVVVARSLQDKNGKEAREETEGNPVEWTGEGKTETVLELSLEVFLSLLIKQPCSMIYFLPPITFSKKFVVNL